MLALRQLAPKAVTAVRPVLGALSGLAVYQGSGALATWLYLLGSLSDVTDGLLARTLKVDSRSGRELDGKADIAFHALVSLGLAGRAVRDRDPAVVLVLATLLATFVLVHFWIKPHRVLGKAMSGLYWVVVFILLVVTVPHQDRLAVSVAALLLGGATFAYEGRVMWRELKSGARRLG
ncbi:MAG: CDP-alcohol phosphatidyltransferase family protein [Actinobacteria bacterium]|nr:CDP-alcohol phosphatidyltransferase family protein [Actinomycetota bacterium]